MLEQHSTFSLQYIKSYYAQRFSIDEIETVRIRFIALFRNSIIATRPRSSSLIRSRKEKSGKFKI